MKSVLISVQPKWCELIAIGKKTVEVRKTRPKIETPFKCYIYCTSSNVHECLMLNENGAKLIHSINYKTAIPCGGHIGNGKVIGEFVCDAIIADKTFGHDVLFKASACMSDADISAYCLNKEMYCWHISNLVIYEQPKELSEFFHYCGDNPTCDGCEAHYYNNTENGLEDYCCSVVDGCRPLKRPPQSWCYVEGKEDEGK